MLLTIWVIAGPAGCGKTTVAEYVSKTLEAPFVEGDSLHSPENIRKMAANDPLTDEDREPWLKSIVPACIQAAGLHSTGTKSHNCVVTCSSLRHRYRNIIRDAARHERDHRGLSVHVRFIYLTADEETLLARVHRRENHYMKESMVFSQVKLQELPSVSEQIDSLIINVTGKTPEQVNAAALKAINELKTS
ncbi:P-loop containing nucleoside triphosphate hydrolase protein [Myxozyma melibiosi]|uniref:Gluconokinase n=1 Tax=Myxozyma melibiosi TaxID=54550 RepID=A0ABR1FCN6_9ASCO